MANSSTLNALARGAGQPARAGLLACVFVAGGTVAAHAEQAPPADEGHRYVRFVKEDNAGGYRFSEIRFLNGEVSYPKLPITSDEGTIEASLIGGEVRNPYVYFDQDQATSQFMKDADDGESAVTLAFAYDVYLTGVEITKPSYLNFSDFRVEVADDPDGTWTVVYATGEDIDNRGESVASFAFGGSPVPVDVTPPAAPSISVASVTQNSASLSWPAVPTAIGYQVFFDGEYRGFTTATTFAQEFTLTPATDYRVEVIAFDDQYNASAPATADLTTAAEEVAQRYRYLRLWLTDLPTKDGRLQLREVSWQMGDRQLPLGALTSSTGDENVVVSSSNENVDAFDGPYKAFDDQSDTHWYVAQGKEVTLEFETVDVVPTGIEFSFPPYLTVGGFRCEASRDGESWDVLYERSGLESGDYVTEGSQRVGRFDFGLALPADLDTEAPSVPGAVSVDRVTSTFAELTWDASTDDGSGLAEYRVAIDGRPWLATAGPGATVYGLSPQTNYDVTVRAVDLLGNVSEAGPTVTATTQALAPSLGAMAVGSGLSSNLTGVFREGVDFAAAWANYPEANPYTETFLTEVSDYEVLRFMDVSPTNHNWLTDWDDRRSPDDPDQSVQPNYRGEEGFIAPGVAIEWMIKLCNLVQADMWINVPHAATADFDSQLAALVERYLDPSLKVYVEYSNEVWNPGFNQATYAEAQGFALGLDQGSFERYAWFGDKEYARFRYYVKRSVELYAAFRNAFGETSDRVEYVLAGWSNQPDVVRVHLDALRDPAINPAGLLPSQYATAPYFGIKARLNIDEPLPAMREQIANTVEEVKRTYAILAGDELALPLISYEAGQHFTVAGETLNRSPAMYQAYIEYMSELSPFFELFTHFVYANPYSRGMAWGAKEYVGQPDIEAFKYRAIRDWQDANVNNAPVGSPVIVDQPSAVTVSEGSGVAIATTVVGRQPMVFEWFRNGTAVADATGSSLMLGQQPAGNDGDVYTFRAANAFGAVDSEPITLTVATVEKALSSRSPSAITVDGLAEAAWEQTAAYPLASVNAGAVAGASDLSGSLRTAWDAQYLYVLVDVTDDVLVPAANPDRPYDYDAVEVYLDVANDKAPTYDANDRQLIYSYQGAGLQGGSGSLTFANAIAAQAATPTGYRVELALSWADLGVDPVAGTFLGFDVMLIDNDSGNAGRDGKLAWWATADESYRRPADFGTLQLADGGEPVVTEVLPLRLTSVCSDDPSQRRRWRVTNPNAFSVSAEWDLYGTGQRASLEAAPGQTFFTTVTHGGANTLRLTWTNEAGATRRQTKASGGAACRQNLRASGPAATSSFHVLPNPAHETLRVTAEPTGGDIVVTLSDATGRQVLRHARAESSAVELSIGHLPRGFYQVSIEQAGQTVIRSVIVE